LCEVIAGETTGRARERKTDDEQHAEDGDEQAGNGDQDAVVEAVAEVAAGDEGDDFDAVQEEFLGDVVEGDDEFGEEVGDAAWVSVFMSVLFIIDIGRA